jgi:hypothetical protein
MKKTSVVSRIPTLLFLDIVLFPCLASLKGDTGMMGPGQPSKSGVYNHPAGTFVSPSGRSLPMPHVPPISLRDTGESQRARNATGRAHRRKRSVSKVERQVRYPLPAPTAGPQLMHRASFRSLCLVCARAQVQSSRVFLCVFSCNQLCGVNGCKKLPYFGPANSKALRCLGHSISGDVYVRARLKAKSKKVCHLLQRE